MLTPEDEKSLPYIGRIEHLYESTDNRDFIVTCWFFHPEETRQGRRKTDSKYFFTFFSLPFLLPLFSSNYFSKENKSSLYLRLERRILCPSLLARPLCWAFISTTRATWTPSQRSTTCWKNIYSSLSLNMKIPQMNTRYANICFKFDSNSTSRFLIIENYLR